MTFTVCFIERREGGSPSIERVFRSVAAELEKKDVRTRFVKVPFGNGVLAILLNLIWFRPPKADVFHITGDVHYIALRLPPSRTLLTVHDLTILNLRTGARRWLIERLFYTWPSRRLRYLTTISQATKSRLTALTDMETKIRVVENPLLVSEESEANEFNVREPTILQLGTAPNKNIGRLIEAISGLRCRLWIVGRIGSEVAKRIDALNIMVRNDESLGDNAV